MRILTTTGRRRFHPREIVVEEARRVRRLSEVFVLERSAQGGGVSDLSCLDGTREVQ